MPPSTPDRYAKFSTASTTPPATTTHDYTVRSPIASPPQVRPRIPSAAGGSLDRPAAPNPQSTPAAPAAKAPEHKPSASVHRASYTTFPPTTHSRPPSLLPPARIAVEFADDPFHDLGPDLEPRRSKGHSRASSSGGLSDGFRNLNRWSASTASSRASNLTNFTRRVSAEVAGAFGSPGRKRHSSRPSTSTTASPPAAEPVPRVRSESPLAPVPPLQSLPQISSGPSLEEEVRGANVLTGLAPRPIRARRPSDDPGLYWDGRPETEGGSSKLAAMPYTQNRESRAHSRSRSAGTNGVLDSGSKSREKDRSSRPPSQKTMLSRALQKANTAVQLDNAQNVEGARTAYAEACELLQQVLQRTTAEEDRNKLEAIHKTYTARIVELDDLGATYDPDEKELPHRPESEDLQDAVDGPDDAAGAEISVGYEEKEEEQEMPSYSVPTNVGRRPLAARTNPSAEPVKEQASGSYNSYLSAQYSLQSAFSKARQDNGLRLQLPVDAQYMPPPLSPRRPISPSHPPPPPPQPEREISDQERNDFSVPGPRLAPAQRGHQRGNSHESVSWLDPIDESAGSSASSVHSRSSSMNIRRRHIRAPSGDTEAEFDAALDDAIEAAYNDGYEPEAQYSRPDEAENTVADALRRVELAREKVRESEREALELANERERRLRLQQQLEDEEYRRQEAIGDDFYDGNDTDEEERILEEMTKGYIIEDFAFGQPTRQAVPRESDSSGWTNRTWHSSMGSTPPTATTVLTTVSEHDPLPPRPAPPAQTLPQLPPQPNSAGSQSSTQSVRNRRLSGQNPKQLKIETSTISQTAPATAGPALPAPKSGSYIVQQRQALSAGPTRTTAPPSARPVPSPVPSTVRDETNTPPIPSLDDLPRSGSPSVPRPGLRKNFSASSLKSIRSRNLSVSNIDDASDISPGTPLSNQYGIGGSSTRLPTLPSIPTPLAAAFTKERSNSTATGGLYLFEHQIHSPTSPGSPNPMMPDAPVPLEPCPNDTLLRPFWLMRCLYQTLCHPRGGYLSNKLFIPRDVWRVKGVKLKNLEDKIANCDYLTAALQKLAKVDNCDADALLEEMQSLEGVLEQVQATLSRKLGAEVGLQGVSALLREAGGAEEAASMPRSASVTNKGSFSWRRLRNKGSSANLPSLATSYGGKGGSGGLSAVSTPIDGPGKEAVLPSLPMTGQPTRRPTKRDIGSVVFTGPNAAYMSSLARLFDAAQAIDQIARQVDDPGLRHADKTQVGLELCTRHAAEFFGFYVSRRNTTKTPSLDPRAAELERRISAIPIDRYRNFCIVAHIDHGKSTLSDRLLEHTGTISASDGNKQILDKLDVERERGITVKAQTCTMIYRYARDGQDYLLHLVDTPGHVDFRAEVTRSYASCGGALLLVDASQGVQAQTVANFYLAFAEGLTLVPVVNKIDLPSADVDRALGQLQDVFELDTSKAVKVSAKTGLGVGDILPAVIEHMPAPVGDLNKPLRMLLVDSWYDTFKGVVLLVRVFDGQLRPGDKLVSFATGKEYIVGEVGIQYPDAVPQRSLRAGQVGYVFFNPGMKRIQDAKIGDTFTTVGSEDKVEPYPGFEEPKPMVFVAAFPTDQGDYHKLADSIGQLVLNDRSITLQKDFSEALGAGWRLGFLGSLHCSVFQDRLRQEHGADIIITEPAVPTKIVYSGGNEVVITNPAEFPDTQDHRLRSARVYEPFVHATMTLPDEYLGRVIEICEAARGIQKGIEFFHATQVILKYELPAASLVDDLFGKLKGATKGYATLDYEDAGWRESDLVKLNLLVNKKPVDAIARVVHSSQVIRLGRQWVTKFKEHVDRQMFEVIIQAAAGNKIVARETIKPFRKDVLAKLHASDITRRRKLLEKQKEGRKKLRAVGNVVIEQAAFQKFLSK
ncbi:hypothetical protein QBC47DRAFT_425856 [Echria macrotheca]|uniref:Tr-type G domain-containing protein n=1 Tax=Echria macrotheca TaxID=438768 RepID=A0AAJ0F516_9PEZI|nr:hypothetical protein QBC47DRAFT_425856 [Echria macrotheca]